MTLGVATLLLLSALGWAEGATTGRPSARLSDGTRVLGFRPVAGVAAFLGLPYALPPIGERRFELPLRVRGNGRTLDATRYAGRCPQFNPAAIDVGGVLEDEDCLYLNVFTPENATSLPVFVHIHGGAFESGSAARYPPANLAAFAGRGGVVVVTLQYRLNLFGFLSAPPALPGNVGLYDQLVALEWVRDNAAAFGGDAARVTLSGQSAGAASISHHIHSPLTDGLFHQAILMSGNVQNPWTIQEDTSPHFNATKNLAIGTGCSDEHKWEKSDFRGLKECLQKISWMELQESAQKLVVEGQGCCAWIPIRDGYIVPRYNLRDYFLFRRRDISVLMGNTHDESFDTLINLHDKGLLQRELITKDLFLHEVQSLSKNMPNDTKYIFENILFHTYASDKWVFNNTEKWFQAIVSLTSGATFFAGTVEEARVLTKISRNIFLYSFDYVSDAFPWPMDLKGSTY